MLLLQALEGRHQVFLRAGTEGGRLIVDEDRPIGVSRRHERTILLPMELVGAPVSELKETADDVVRRVGRTAGREPHSVVRACPAARPALIFLSALRNARRRLEEDHVVLGGRARSARRMIPIPTTDLPNGCCCRRSARTGAARDQDAGGRLHLGQAALVVRRRARDRVERRTRWISRCLASAKMGTFVRCSRDTRR